MNAVVQIESATHLPSLIDRAAKALSGARSSAEILEARDMASIAYDVAKKTARLSKAKGAHDALIAAAHRAQADALEIEAGAKRRLADEYDAAQERGEIATGSVRADIVPKQNDVRPATSDEVGISRKVIHEARTIRDAEVAEPGIVRRVLDEKLAQREEPTKAALREAVTEAAMRGLRGSPAPSRKNPNYEQDAQWDAMLAVSAGCRDMMDKVRGLSPEYILGGFIDEGQRARNLSAIRECKNFLGLILEAANAQ